VKGDRYNKKEALFARSVIALNLLFFFSQLPYLILFIVKNILKEENVSPVMARINFAYTFSQAIATYNYIFPSVVNFMFNRMFHDEVCMLFGIKLKKSKSEKNNTNESSGVGGGNKVTTTSLNAQTHNTRVQAFSTLS
jgi:hypothetical protein